MCGIFGVIFDYVSSLLLQHKVRMMEPVWQCTTVSIRSSMVSTADTHSTILTAIFTFAKVTR